MVIRNNRLWHVIERNVGQPVASFTVNPSEGIVPLTVDFDGSGSDDRDGTGIASYQWDWTGDGTIDEVTAVPATSHTYTSAQVYTPKLTVVTNGGLVSSPAARTVNVSPLPDPLIRWLPEDVSGGQWPSSTTPTQTFVPDTGGVELQPKDAIGPDRAFVRPGKRAFWSDPSNPIPDKATLMVGLTVNDLNSPGFDGTLQGFSHESGSGFSQEEATYDHLNGEVRFRYNGTSNSVGQLQGLTKTYGLCVAQVDGDAVTWRVYYLTASGWSVSSQQSGTMSHTAQGVGYGHFRFSGLPSWFGICAGIDVYDSILSDSVVDQIFDQFWRDRLDY